MPCPPIGGAHDVIVDHCSLTWATDENLSASGPRFTGKTPRRLAQGHLASDHVQQQHHRRGPRGLHSLQGRALQGLADPRQRHRHPDRRQPLRAQPRAQPAVQGRRARRRDQQPDLRPGPARGALQPDRGGVGHDQYQTGQMTLVGNVLRAGPSTPTDLAFLMLGGSGDLEYLRGRQHRGGPSRQTVAGDSVATRRRKPA